jgi:hypothetical protein
MPIILIVENNGNIRELNLKTLKEDELHHIAGFKNSDNFNFETSWSVKLEQKHYEIFLYAKNKGKHSQENKYEFPPPVDQELYFGNCILLNKKKGELSDLSKNEWDMVYDYLYSGFEKIGEEYSEEEDDIEDADGNRVKLSKDGYVKDGFIVDSGSDDEISLSSENSFESEEEDEDEAFEKELINQKLKRQNKNKNDKKTKTKNKTNEIKMSEKDVNVFDCTDELTEEEYV